LIIYKDETHKIQVFGDYSLDTRQKTW